MEYDTSFSDNEIIAIDSLIDTSIKNNLLVDEDELRKSLGL